MQSCLMKTEAQCKPPKNFKQVKGLTVARLVNTPQFAQAPKKATGSRRKGLIYEARVQDFLERTCGEDWIPFNGPWFEFEDIFGHRYAQADWFGVNVAKGLICIVEIKLSRVARAWWQLNGLYEPLVKKIFPYFDVAKLEIAASVQDVKVPEKVKVIWDLDKVRAGETRFLKVPYAG